MEAYMKDSKKLIEKEDEKGHTIRLSDNVKKHI